MIFQYGKSQTSGYSVNSFNSDYIPLEDSISLNNGEVWDNPDYVIPLGFNFLFFDQYIDTLYFYFEGSACILSDSNEEGGTHKMIIPFGSALIDRGYETEFSQSPLSYSLSGNTGDMIAKIEWKNAGFWGEYDVLGTLDDFVNFQLWLYETEGRIDVRFGPRLITHPDLGFMDGGPAVSLIPSYDYWFDLISPNSVWLVNDPFGPDIINSSEYQFLDFMPPLNQVYQFTNLVSSTKILDYESIEIFPNPVTNFLYFRNSDDKEEMHIICIYDMAGSVVLKKEISLIEILNIDLLISGFYYVTLTDLNGGINTFKICKL